MNNLRPIGLFVSFLFLISGLNAQKVKIASLVSSENEITKDESDIFTAFKVNGEVYLLKTLRTPDMKIASAEPLGSGYGSDMILTRLDKDAKEAEDIELDIPSSTKSLEIINAFVLDGILYILYDDITNFRGKTYSFCVTKYDFATKKQFFKDFGQFDNHLIYGGTKAAVSENHKYIGLGVFKASNVDELKAYYDRNLGNLARNRVEKRDEFKSFQFIVIDTGLNVVSENKAAVVNKSGINEQVAKFYVLNSGRVALITSNQIDYVAAQKRAKYKRVGFKYYANIFDGKKVERFDLNGNIKGDKDALRGIFIKEFSDRIAFFSMYTKNGNTIDGISHNYFRYGQKEVLSGFIDLKLPNEPDKWYGRSTDVKERMHEIFEIHDVEAQNDSSFQIFCMGNAAGGNNIPAYYLYGPGYIFSADVNSELENINYFPYVEVFNNYKYIPRSPANIVELDNGQKVLCTKQYVASINSLGGISPMLDLEASSEVFKDVSKIYRSFGTDDGRIILHVGPGYPKKYTVVIYTVK
jgi:hypothetical protein